MTAVNQEPKFFLGKEPPEVKDVDDGNTIRTTVPWTSGSSGIVEWLQFLAQPELDMHEYEQSDDYISRLTTMYHQQVYFERRIRRSRSSILLRLGFALLDEMPSDKDVRRRWEREASNKYNIPLKTFQKIMQIARKSIRLRLDIYDFYDSENEDTFPVF